jgi:hypothetical protein
MKISHRHVLDLSRFDHSTPEKALQILINTGGQKTLLSILAVLRFADAILLGGEDAAVQAETKAIGRDLRAALGPGWTHLTAMQYLTGQEADWHLSSYPGLYQTLGYPPPLTEMAVTLANFLCAQGRSKGPLSSGLLVGYFRDRPQAEVALRDAMQRLRNGLSGAQ